MSPTRKIGARVIRARSRTIFAIAPGLRRNGKRPGMKRSNAISDAPHVTHAREHPRTVKTAVIEIAHHLRDRPWTASQRKAARHEAIERHLRRSTRDARARASAHREDRGDRMAPPEVKRNARPEVEMARDVAGHHAEVDVELVERSCGVGERVDANQFPLPTAPREGGRRPGAGRARRSAPPRPPRASP